MSNKSNLQPAQDHDLNKLIAEKNAKEQQEKLDKELVRQKEIINGHLLPFLYNSEKSVTSAKILLNNTLKTLNKIFEDKMKEEQRRLSASTLIQLDVLERLERDESLQQQISLIDKLKDETIGTATGILNGLHVLIAGSEATESDKKKLKDLGLHV